MAEYVEVMEQGERMCKSYRGACEKCGLSVLNNKQSEVCIKFIMNHPAEAQKIIMDWAAEHPTKTNADKFREVFGVEVDDSYECKILRVDEKCKNSECKDCEYNDFWNKEYKEQKG